MKLILILVLIVLLYKYLLQTNLRCVSFEFPHSNAYYLLPFLGCSVLLFCLGQKMISWTRGVNDIVNSNDVEDTVVNGHEVCVVLVHIQGSISGRRHQ